MLADPLFARDSEIVTVSPGSMELLARRLSASRCAPLAIMFGAGFETNVTALAELFALFGSLEVVTTFAMFVIFPAMSVVAVIEKETELPALRLPSAQVITLPATETEVSAETYAAEAGKRFVTTIPLAVSGPLLVTRNRVNEIASRNGS